MNWKRTADSTYLVRWPDGVWKAGYSSKQRWRAFVIRGAEVLRVAEFTNFVDASADETRMDLILAAHGRPAFAGKEEAEPYLGVGGGGYKECFRIAQEDAPGMLRALLGSVVE